MAHTEGFSTLYPQMALLSVVGICEYHGIENAQSIYMHI